MILQGIENLKTRMPIVEVKMKCQLICSKSWKKKSSNSNLSFKLGAKKNFKDFTYLSTNYSCDKQRK